MKKEKVSGKSPKKSVIAKKTASEPLKVCTTAPHAEMARNENKAEPCDDGRGG